MSLVRDFDQLKKFNVVSIADATRKANQSEDVEKEQS